MLKIEVLKFYVKEARRRGYKVSGTTNAGGWKRLAKALGHSCASKLEAKQKVAEVLGPMPMRANVQPPWETPKVTRAASDEFLGSYAWRKLRMQAIKKYGRRCQCCGATPAYGVVIHVDHIKPRRKYPELALEINNLQILCEICNHGKGNWDETDWRPTEEEMAHLKDIMLH